MKVKTNCEYFEWKNKFFVADANKIDQCFLKEPYCKLNKLVKTNCPENCKYFTSRN